MKLGIVGVGYWGKIIINNLQQLNYKNLVLCDSKDVLDNLNLGRKFESTTNYKKLKCDKVFVLTPAIHHYEICKYFLKQGKSVFCEKVLTPNTDHALELYHLAKENNCKLFVDWVFTFNSEVNKIKEIYDSGALGEIKHVTMNRQNYGPFRNDVDARYDLASHDLSILMYIFNNKLEKINWINYKRDQLDTQNDSTLSLLQFDKFTATINASWRYSKKDRKCFFDFQQGLVEWDDVTKSLNVESECDIIIPEGDDKSPLHKSLLSFLKNKNFNYSKQQQMTINIIGALNGD